MMNNKMPKDQQVREYTTLFKTMCDNTPNQIIELVGPYLWDEREKISNGDVGYFLEKEYVREDDKLFSLVCMMKKLWKESGNKDRSLVSKTINMMLGIYADYLRESMK
jgi:hypothetical protein